MAYQPLPPLSFLVECFAYEAHTGKFFWKRRPSHHFPEPIYAEYWNRQHAGNETFTRRDPEGYRRAEVRYQGRRYRLRASRVALLMAYGIEAEMVDHRNHQTDDDRLENLRPADRFENAQHQRKKSGDFTTHLKGAFFDKHRGKWRARVYYRKKIHDCGNFDSAEEAHAAYCRTAATLHGDFFHAGQRQGGLVASVS